MGPDGISFNIAIDACAQAGNMTEAVVWFHRMGSARLQPDAIECNSLLNACARTSQANLAVEWLDRMAAASAQPTVVSYTSAISACEKAGKHNAGVAEDLFCRMVSSGLIPDQFLMRVLRGALGWRRVEMLQAQLGFRVSEGRRRRG